MLLIIPLLLLGALLIIEIYRAETYKKRYLENEKFIDEIAKKYQDNNVIKN